MPRFLYRSTRTMEPRPGVNYATVYYKQSPAEHERIKEWFADRAQEIMEVCAIDPGIDHWYSSNLPRFKKSQRGQYYTSEELLTDILGQLMRGNDLPDAMLNRWNRWCDGTPWCVELQDQARPTPGYRNLFVQPKTPKTPVRRRPKA